MFEEIPWNLVSSVGLVFTIPYIFYKVARTVYIKHMYSSTLIDKVVVITGASSGIGEALAHEFYKRGCQVVLCARRRQELERVRNDLLEAHSIVHTLHPIVVPLDLSDIASLKDSANKILSMTERVDILVNNGGISNRGSAVDTDIDVDIDVMKVNHFGTVALVKALLPSMIQRKQGHIVAVSSVQGLLAIPERSAYSASKHAMQGFHDSLRAELHQHNIYVTVANPGYVKTALSVNALTGSGKKHGEMDANTEKGYPPEYVAEKIVAAVVQRKKELIVATFVVRVAIFIRRYIPCLYYLIMAKRAKKM